MKRNLCLMVLGLMSLAGLCQCGHAASTADRQGCIRLGESVLGEIVTPTSPSATLAFAAQQLQHYAQQMLGSQLAVSQGEPRAGVIYLDVAPEGSDLAGRLLGYRKDRHDRSLMRAHEGCLYIVGENPRSLLYGVYDFLKAYGGVRFFGPGAEHEMVPAQDTLALPADARLEVGSVFKYRDYFAFSAEAVDYAMKNRICSFVSAGEDHASDLHQAIELRDGLFRGPGHIWRTFLPDASLFDEHPEYFPLIEGKRQVTGTGACFSNPAVREIFREKLRAYFRANPFWDIFGLWAEDCYYPHYCECEECLKKETGDWYMTISNIGAQVLAEELPDARYEFIAYHETRWPPKGVPELYDNGRNMLLNLCLGYTRDLYNPLEARTGGNAEVMDMYGQWRDWLAQRNFQGETVLMEYYNWCEAPNMGPSGRCLLWPMETIRTDTLFYQSEGIDGLGSWICFKRLCWPTPFNVWAWFQLYHDPSQTIEQLEDEFYPAYFGPQVGPQVRAYMHRLQAVMVEPTTPENLEQVKALKAELDAIKVPADQPQVAHRLEVVKSHWDFCVLHKTIWIKFQSGDEDAWKAMEQPYRDFLDVKWRELLTGEVDIPALWQYMWYDFFAKRGPEGIQGLLSHPDWK